MRKYGNIPQIVDGIKFDSIKEATRWGELRLLEKGGEISDLRRQVRIPLEGRDGPIRFQPSKRQAVYVADFVYIDKRTGLEVIEDSKGMETKDFKLKRAVLAAMGVEITLT